MHYWQYAVSVVNQNAEAAITEAQSNLAQREEARRLQAQQPLTAHDLKLIGRINDCVRASANADGKVTAQLHLVVENLETPPLVSEGNEVDQS